MTEDERRAAGLLFVPGDPELSAQKLKAHRLSREYNLTDEEDREKRQSILCELFASAGKGTSFLGPIAVHYGCHTRIGDGCFFGFNFTLQDDAEVTIGEHCLFGPNVTIVTPVHPMRGDERRSILCNDGKQRYLCAAKPVHIGSNCWICAGVTVCPGVTVGDDCVIGAGSVVTRDIPPHSFAAGNPARVIREITEEDRAENSFTDLYGEKQTDF